MQWSRDVSAIIVLETSAPRPWAVLPPCVGGAGTHPRLSTDRSDYWSRSMRMIKRCGSSRRSSESSGLVAELDPQSNLTVPSSCSTGKGSSDSLLVSGCSEHTFGADCHPGVGTGLPSRPPLRERAIAADLGCSLCASHFHRESTVGGAFGKE